MNNLFFSNYVISNNYKYCFVSDKPFQILQINHSIFIQDDNGSKLHKIDSVSFPGPSFKSNQGFNPFLVVEDPKLDSLCEVIKNIKAFHPTLATSMMANQGLVKTIHDMTYDMAVERVGIPSMHSSAILKNSDYAAPAASMKPTPLQHISYDAIADGECFLHYIKRCGGCSVQSAALIISQILKKHGNTFIDSPNRKKDNGLEHIVQYIMFTTVLSQRFADVLGEIIESATTAGDDTAVVVKLGPKIFGVMEKCLRGDSDTCRKDCKKVLKLEPSDLYKMVFQYRDILVYHSDEQSAENKFATYLPKELTFQSKFSGWYYRTRKIVNNKERDHEDAGEPWIVAQEDILARILGVSMVENKTITDKKQTAIPTSE